MSEEVKKSLSFGFAKKSSVKKLEDSKLRDESTKDKREETDFIIEVDRTEIKGTKKKEVKEELIIPYLPNTYKKKIVQEPVVKAEHSELLAKPDEELTEEEKAAKELLKESKAWQEAQDQAKNPNDNLVIQSQANANNGLDSEKAIFEADLESRPDVSTADDYEKIPVQGFGMALLKGMGFKDKEGIGGFRKAKIECLDPVIRPKGLGLGATPSASTSKSSSESKEKLVLKRDAYVKVAQGSHQGNYGQVESLDEDNARVYIKIKGNVVSVSENSVQVVHKKEFDKFKNVINKDMYDKYSAKQKEREKDWKKRPIFEDLQQEEKQSSSSSKKSKSAPRTWVRPKLRVRIIDRKSKYYKEKVDVNDVISSELIQVVTDSGKILEIDPEDVETVIPKNDFAKVMIVRKEHKGQIAEMLRKDSRNEKVTVRILPDKDEVLELRYDYICQLVHSDYDDHY